MHIFHHTQRKQSCDECQQKKTTEQLNILHTQKTKHKEIKNEGDTYFSTDLFSLFVRPFECRESILEGFGHLLGALGALAKEGHRGGLLRPLFITPSPANVWSNSVRNDNVI